MAKIKLQDVKKAVDIGKEVLPFVEPAIRKYGPEVADQASKKAKEVADAVEGARDSVFGRIKQRKDTKGQKKTLKEARKKAVASSLPPIPADEFFKNFESNVSDSERLKDGYMAIAGCYAIITMKSPREKDLSAYRDVYVGCSRSLGFAVYSQLRGFGNVDVYADFKFKEPMKILLFPCEEAELAERYAELMESLQSARSYNERDFLSASAANE